MSDIIDVVSKSKEDFKAPRKPLKRKIAETDKMETESVESSGVESTDLSETMEVSILPKVSISCIKFPSKTLLQAKAAFPPIKREKLADGCEVRKIPVPRHRYSPLKENWMKIFEPIVEHLKLQIRFNLKTRNVEVRTCKDTEDVTLLQKAADFVKVKQSNDVLIVSIQSRAGVHLRL